MNLIALTLCTMVAIETGGKREIDTLNFTLEVSAHLPGDRPAIDRNLTRLESHQLQPAVHELALSYGVGMERLASELVVRGGYGYSEGALAAGSEIGADPITGYHLRTIPITAGWRAHIAPTRARLLLGLDLGGSFASMSYSGSDASSGWQWRFGIRALAGVHIDLIHDVALRLFVEGRMQQAVVVARGPDVALSGLGAGIGLTFAPPRPQAGSWRRSRDDSEERLPYEGLSRGDGMERASALIREADEAARRHDFITAEPLYRRGVRLLPRDPQTRRNLEVPVRVDWARALVEVGRRDEAITVLQEALRIQPDHGAAMTLLRELGGEAVPTRPEMFP